MSKKPTQKPIHSNIEFRNLGKIKEANIQIRPFTVIAGCNSSGKSFITKSLYSLFSGMGRTNKEYIVAELVTGLLLYSEDIIHLPDFLKISVNSELEAYIKKLEQEVQFLEDLSHKEMTYLQASPALTNIDLLLGKLQVLFKKGTKSQLSLAGIEEDASLSKKDKRLVPHFFELAHTACNTLSDHLSNPDIRLNDAICMNIAESLRDNFTISSTSQLVHFNKYCATIKGDDFGLVKITDKIDAVANTISKINTFNAHPPIYLESPIYWKLSDALEDSKKALDITAKKRNLFGNQLVSKVPKYFFDVLELLDDQVKTDLFNDIAQTIEEAIKGSLSISDGGIKFVDKESNKAVSLSVTALGITNLGMIALLLERGAILPGTFLFIDEPEVHLHPMWQVVLVQVLHELSKRGVNVVIASHSIDIMKAIENLMNSDEDIDQQTHFGLNQLTEDGHSIDVTDNNFKRIAAIKEDLGKPFYDMFMGA